MIQWTKLLDELLDVEAGLTDWEVQFVEDMDKKRRNDPLWRPTDTEMDKIVEIYEERA